MQFSLSHSSFARVCVFLDILGVGWGSVFCPAPRSRFFLPESLKSASSALGLLSRRGLYGLTPPGGSRGGTASPQCAILTFPCVGASLLRCTHNTEGHPQGCAWGVLSPIGSGRPHPSLAQHPVPGTEAHQSACPAVANLRGEPWRPIQATCRSHG